MSTWYGAGWDPYTAIADELFESEEAKKKRQALERRVKVNGEEPKSNRYCNCGAKFDREFPNIHSTWCNVYVETK